MDDFAKIDQEMNQDFCEPKTPTRSEVAPNQEKASLSTRAFLTKINFRSEAKNFQPVSKHAFFN